MNHKGLFEKIISMFLSLLMILSAFLGYIPGTVEEVHAEGLKLEEIKKTDNILKVDPTYDLANDILVYPRKPADFKTNLDNNYKKWYKRTLAKDDKVWQLTENLKDGKINGENPYIILYKAGQGTDPKTQKLKYYNLKITVYDYKEFPQHMHLADGTECTPIFGFYTKNAGISMNGIEWISAKFQWSEYKQNADGTPGSKAIADVEHFNCYVTLDDLDWGQAFTFSPESGINKLWKLKGNTHITQDANGIVNSSPNVGMDPPDEDGWVMAYTSETTSFKVRFYNGPLPAAPNTYQTYLVNGLPAMSYYGYTAKSFFDITPPEPPTSTPTPTPTIPPGTPTPTPPPKEPQIYKKVGPKGSGYSSGGVWAKEKELAYEINDYDEYEYFVLAYSPEAEVASFEITDTLEDCLTIADDTKVKINGLNREDLTSRFNIKISGQTIKVTAKSEFLKSDKFKEKGQFFCVRYTVHRRKDKNVREFMGPWLDEDGYTFHVNNTGTVRYETLNGKTKTLESNNCWVTDTIDSRLTIEKDAKYDGWKVGDIVTYAVEVTQTRQDAYAVNLEITDNSIPPSLKLVNNSWKVSGPNYGEAASISSDDENGWICTCPLLMYGDSVKIEFKCLATADSNGQDWVNTAAATAENFMDKYGEQLTVTDSAEIWVNSPVLTVDNVADRYEYEVGDIVNYTVNVINTADYTIAENVVVSDIDLPEGLVLQGEPTIDLGEAQDSIGWPVPDGTAAIATNQKENFVEAEQTGNTWTVKARYLPSGQPLTINFSCVANVAANGVETQNVATATADNFLSLDQNQEPLTAQDDAEVYVNTAAFDIEKKISDGTYEWQVGDHVPFDVTIKNINDEGTVGLADAPAYAGRSEEERAKIGAAGKTVARNVVITDADIPEGFILDTDTVEVVAVSVEDEVNAQVDAMLAEDAAAVPTEEDILAEYGLDLGDDELLSEDIINEDELLNGVAVAAETGADTWEPHVPTPAEPMTVEGIPDSYDDHIAGTPDVTNEVDETLWNETETKAINYNLETVGNGWRLTISDLPAGHEVKVHFTCLATQDGNGQEGVNIGSVTAENGIERADDSEAYINTAVLTIDKQVVNKYAAGGAENKQDGRENYEYRVGEDIEYRLVVNNNQRGSVARNVVITDETIPLGMNLDPASIKISGLPEVYTNPVAGTDDPMSQTDPDHYAETTVEPIISNTEITENGFRITIDNLPCTTGDDLNGLNEPIIITYHCVPEETINGMEIINTAKIHADNSSESSDSERIWVNSPVLQVVKKADRDEYSVGDTITYQVDASQEQIGCVAREVTFEDTIDTEGVKLDKSSIVLIDSDGNVIEPERVEINGNHFIVHTGRHLIKASPYTQINLDKRSEENDYTGTIQKGGFNPLGIDRETSMTLEYAVEIVDPALAGQTVHNIVTVNSREDIPVSDETTVPIYGPELDITKESDKTQYQVGEEGLYKLTIRELREGITAKNIVVTDTFQQEGMEISKINVRLNGQKIDAQVEMTADNAFVINTGIDLIDSDKLEVFYAVLFKDPALADQHVLNVATAKGDNTEEEMQDNSVLILDENPGLEIEKKSDKEFYKIGEIGHYTVTVSNKEKGTTARNVIIKDELVTDGAKIVKDSIVIKNDNGKVMDDAELQYSDTRYAIYTGHDLEYKEQFTVTYDVLFETESLAGKDIMNIARATCDNLRVETKEPDPITLSNGLEVYKYADPKTGSVVKNGNDIKYSIRVTNTTLNPMKNILVKDAIPEYTTYISSEEQEGVITGNRTLNGKEYATFVIENLAAGEERTVSFTVTVTDAPEEEMILNVAQVRNTRFDLEDMTDETWNHESFRNTNEVIHYTDTRWVKDENIVYIDGGKLDVEKSSDKTNYSVGETGHYTVKIRQRVNGAIARNVAAYDVIQEKGAYIQADTIKAYLVRDGEETELKDIVVTAKDFHYDVQTNASILYGEEIHIRYDVLFKEATQDGQQIKNVVYARDDSTKEGDEPKDDNRVTVGEGGLLIEKTSDKNHYQVGDVGKYSLKITCSDPARTIKNVVVKDVMKQRGAHLVTGTVRTYFDDKEIKVNVQEKDNGFLVETGKDLSGTHAIYIKYDVVFEEASLEGKKVENIATTWGDNTTPSDDDHTVTIGEIPDKPDNPDKPDKPDKPDNPDKPDKPDNPDNPVKGMTITKKANKTAVSVGDTVTYTLEAKVNSGSESAKNVVISDSFDKAQAEYLAIVEDSVACYIDDAQIRPEALNVTKDGFTVKTGKDLAPGSILKVTYNVIFRDETLKGQTVKNIATVSSDNMEPATDKEIVTVKTDDPLNGSMSLEKKANTAQAYVGDTVTYTLIAKTNTADKAAENVVLTDTFDSAQAGYVEILEDSFRCYIDNGQFKPSELNITKDGFTIKTGKDLKPGATMKVTYDVVFKSEALKGQTVKNTAVVSSDNMEPAKDKENIPVKTDDPTSGGMTLEKKANILQATVGDTVTYTLTAKTNTADKTAKNVVLTDTFDSTQAGYVEIVDDSFRCYLDDAQFMPKELNLTKGGFTIKTGKDLKPGAIMKVTYDVVFKSEVLKGQTVKNTAVVSSDNMEPAKDKENIPVKTDDPASGGMTLDKKANTTQAKVGDTVTYTLIAKTNTSNKTAKNVFLSDTFDSNQSGYVEILGDSLRCYLDDAQFKPSELNMTKDGFTIKTGKDLAPGSVMKVTYDVVFKSEKLKGQTVKNTAIISSDNMEPTKDKENIPVKTDDGLSGGMTLEKKADKIEASVGDTVTYTLEATVNGEETAKSVSITDTFDSSVAQDVEIDRDSFRCYLDNAQFQPKALNLTKNGFTLQTGQDLAPGQVIRVTYNVKLAGASLKGQTVKNTAVASSENLNPSKDTDIVKVKEDDPVKGGLDIIKTADHTQVNIGETVKYTLTVKTTGTEAAKNVVISDSLDTDGAVIVKGSIHAYLNNEAFTPEKLTAEDAGFTMKTGKNLAKGEVMKVTYEVRAGEALGGKTVKNIAAASSDNFDSVDDDNSVTVNPPAEKGTPELSIDKVANVSQAYVGDTVTYTVQVRQTEKDAVAENVIIEDAFNVSGMEINNISATLDGAKISVNAVRSGNGFTIQTGQNLAYGSELKLVYTAVVKDQSLAGRMVENNVTAGADNAENVSANASVNVSEQETNPTEAPKNPTVNPDDTTNTVGPKTGLINHAGVYAGIGAAILAVIATILIVRRKKMK